MGFRYQAEVVFPVRALEIEEIKAWVDRNMSLSNGQIEIGIEYVTVTNDNANYGQISVTELLEKHCIPFDHEHTEGEGRDGAGYSFVRFAEGVDAVASKLEGTSGKVETWLSYEQHAVAVSYKKCLELLNAGDLDALRKELEARALEVSELK
jgi:hypothetical protein